MDQILNSLCTALNERDGDTHAHCHRVVALAQELGRHIELNSQELTLLGLGAALHDIGKIGIPDRVLHKPGRFAEEELATMRRHPLIGERIVRAIADARADTVAQVVRHHHEHFDGSGYPDGLRGTDIPLFARIVSLSDNYDAMAAPRPYHSGRSHREIIEILCGSDADKFDPDLLHAFRHVIERSPMRAA